MAAMHAAFLEICVPNRMDTDHCGPTSQGVPYPRELRGKPRFTLVSDGKPLRRLLIDWFLMVFLLLDGFARRITEEEGPPSFYLCRVDFERISLIFV